MTTTEMEVKTRKISFHISDTPQQDVIEGTVGDYIAVSGEVRADGEVIYTHPDINVDDTIDAVCDGKYNMLEDLERWAEASTEYKRVSED
jgi:hypothetical protein